MEHSDPLFAGPYGQPRDTGTPFTPPAITSPSSGKRQDGISQQSRRLQLRNAGFRGSVLPSRRLTPTFGTSHTDPFNKNVNNENSPLSIDKRSLYGEDMPPSTVNILQEIHNSTRRKRHSARPAISHIFQDHTATESTSGAGGTSWYSEQSNNCSPASSNPSPVNMLKLREGSLNQKTPPPLSSPLAKHVKGRNLNRLNLRSTSFEATKYIEHLESQLTALNAKLDSLVSPNTNKARAAKLRALTVEARSLRHELADWEKNFAERVKDGVEERLGAEINMKAQLEALQDDSDIKDMKIKELEFELETLRLKAKDTEALEITNINLEKRIDVLTSLLVQSPTKLDFSSAASSPGKVDPQKRLSRPMSMLPRAPSSPGGVRLSLPTVNESTFWQNRGLRSDLTASKTPEDLRKGTNKPNQESSEMTSTEQGLKSPHIESATSSSSYSVPSPSSRPTSLHSSSSIGSNSWGLPFSAERDIFARSTNRQRRMRRFPSGSCSLKPLILPSGAGTPSLPASAPVYVPSDTPRRDMTDITFDPTTAFLSQHNITSPIATPTQPGRRTSTTLEQERALQALEGHPGYPDERLEDVLIHSPMANVEEHFSEAIRADSQRQSRRKSRPKSLEEELKKACFEAKEIGFSGSFSDGLIPIEGDSSKINPHRERKSAESDSTLIGIDADSGMPPSSANQLKPHNIPSEEDITPKPPKKPILITSPSKSLPSTALATRTIYGLFGRLTDVIARAKQEPLVLARRLLYNAWSTGSGRLGGVAWWLIGLVLGREVWKRKSKADAEIGEESKVGRRSDGDASLIKARGQQIVGYDMRKPGKPEQPKLSIKSPQLQHREMRVQSHFFPCDECVEPSSRRTLRLWLKFSLAIILAIGIAIKDGPEALLVERVPQQHSKTPDVERKDTLHYEAQTITSSAQGRQHGLTISNNRMQQRKRRREKPIHFVNILRPEDFEGRQSPLAPTHHWPC